MVDGPNVPEQVAVPVKTGGVCRLRIGRLPSCRIPVQQGGMIPPLGDLLLVGHLIEIAINS